MDKSGKETSEKEPAPNKWNLENDKSKKEKYENLYKSEKGTLKRTVF